MKQPWLSILIPTYNGAKYLPFALDSIVAQNDLDIECIVVDDGSTDATLAILKDYQHKLPLKIVDRQRQGNWVTNTNYALSLASADYVCFLHQDDIWLRGRLKTFKNLIATYPEINLFLHSSQFIDRQGNYLGLWQCPLPKSPRIADANTVIEKLLIQNFIAIPAPIFKREIALQVGGLDEHLWYTADWDFWLKIVASGQTLYYPKPLAAFRVHPNSQTIARSSSLDDFRQQLEVVAQKYFELWTADRTKKKAVWKVACFSIEVNTTLAGAIHDRKTNFFKLFYSFLALGVPGWYRYLSDSRIWERVFARLRARLTSIEQSK
jgi:glycosyltransferase involved in cell wall biosynthesis